MNFTEQTVLTGIRATGHPHLGNFVGAIQPALHLAKQFNNSLFFIADYHALITKPNPQELQDNIFNVTATWLACGLDPEKSIIYRQSDIPEILELNWILSCFTPKGYMNKAHSYKAAIDDNAQQKKKDLDIGISMGLYNYPVLMAADILTFNADVVPVGKDQIQHLEICRDIVQKVHRHYKINNLFHMPFHKTTSQILNADTKSSQDNLSISQNIAEQDLLLGLDGQKMSKSYSNHIPLFVEEKKLKKLIMKIKTDSSPPNEPKNPHTSPVMNMYKFFATSEEINKLQERHKEGISWGEAKEQLFQTINENIMQKRAKFNSFISNPKAMEQILKQGAKKARNIAQPILKKVKSTLFNQQRGMTLLEVLISLTIFTSGAVVIATSWSGTLLKHRKTKIYHTVTHLLSKKMIEIEAKYKNSPLNEVPKEEAGDFGKEYVNYRWLMQSQNIPLPSLKNLIEDENEISQTAMTSMENLIKESIKELRVTIFVQIKKKELKYSLTTYLVDYKKSIGL